MNPRVLRLLAAGVRLLAAGVVLNPLPAAVAAHASGAQVIPLTSVLGGQLAFQANVGGSNELFLFDSGGGGTVISPALATKVGCNPWGQVTGFRMRGQRLDLKRCDDFQIEVRGRLLHSPTAGVFDILEGAPKSAPPIAGSVGLDMFIGEAITLDVGQKRLIIESPRSLKQRIRHAHQLVARFERDLQGLAREVLVAADTPKGRLWLEIDCGSDGNAIVNRPYATALGLDGSMKGSQLFKLKLAGGPEIDTPGHLEDLIRDGNIGVRVLKDWVVTIDERQEKVWIAPSRS